MISLVVVENTKRWPLHLPGTDVVSAKSYLTEPRFSELRGAAVFNLCRTYGYQTVGGHRPLPSVETIQDLRLSPLLRIVSEDLDEIIQRSLATLRSPTFELSIYFGRNVASRYDRLSQALFNQFPAPFLRASFAHEDGSWQLAGIRAIATSEIPEAHREFVIERATYFFGRPSRPHRPKEYRYDLAILAGPEEEAPSDEVALRKFIRAARTLDMDATIIEREDYGRVAEFDALFIRETTAVNHHTYRFSRRAAAEGLVVIDDPASIVRCTNKVYQAELFGLHGIASPKTLVVHAGNVGEVEARVGLPCILKQPDSAFSQGVVKACTSEELHAHLERLLEGSDLVIAQEYVQSTFDWRIGVLNGQPLYACKYHMARGHWQIIHTDKGGRRRYGKVEGLPLEAVPAAAVDLGARSAGLIGDGLYGVDIKEVDGRFLVMEVNDNPTIEAGYEDAVCKDELYLTIMRYFRERLDARGGRRPPA
jgi:glutathione synthase/RimK-type ligase-like ATP-grasp enzyme